MNHLFVPDESGDFLRYHELPSAKLDPRVLGAVGDWVTTRLAVGGALTPASSDR